jgi:cellulose synthase/poly-beta-1,6-N-acetylglucosamine synthase-like glycosyltransferase
MGKRADWLIFEAVTPAWIVILIVYIIHGAYTTISFISINAKLRRKAWISPPSTIDTPLCLIIPLYKEDEGSIAKTFTSLAEQDYPHDLARTIIVIEQGDDATFNSVNEKLRILKDTGFKTEIIVKPPPRSTKALALNYALTLVKEPVIGIYDGGDVIADSQQLRRAVSLLASGCDGVGMRVIRGGNGIVSTFSWIDTTMWCDVTLPALTCLLRSPLVSGEGLFVRKDAMETLGGFPNSLTEDSHLTLLFAQRGLSMKLLNRTVYEGAPMDLNNLIRQKLRWHRGISFCFRQTIMSKLPIRRKIELTLAYSAPVVLVAISLSFLIIVLGILDPWIIPGFILWWSLFIVISTMTAPIYLTLAKYSIPVRSILLLPFYWFVVGLLTLYAFFSPRISWYRTSKRADFPHS